tara:strand:- start:206 stop:772 length:567 start_codon:yes stop_codon:yes gene_type:complete
MLALIFISCSGDDGSDGIDGIDGTPGVKGTDGVNGTNGTDGVDGVNGADGNANAQAFYYDATENGGSNFAFDVPEFTEEVLLEDTILVYLKITEDTTIAIPGTIFGNIAVEAYFQLSTAIILFYDIDTGADFNIPLGSILGVKIIIIKSNSFVERSSLKSANTDVLSKLKADGIDVNDYDAVAAYFNL